MGQLVFQAALGGQVALAGPNTASSYTLNLPTVNGNVVSTGDTATVTNTMLATNVYTAPGTIGSGTANTGAFTSLSATSFTNTGTDTATKFIPTGSSVTGNGLYLPAANALGLSTNGTNALYIDASQNVGIGTTSPSQRLSVAATTGVINLTSTTGTNFSLLSVVNTGTSFYCGIESSTGASLFTGTSPYSGIIGTTGAYPMAFATNNAERMRIDSSGNLLVGTTSTNPISSRVNGFTTGPVGFITLRGASNMGLGLSGTSGNHIAFYTDNGTTYVSAGTISSNGSTTSYNATSDYRLKDNVQPLTNALNRITQLRPVTWTWKEGHGGTQPNCEGFIAHELQSILPVAVTGEKDAVDAEGNPIYQGVDTSFLVATLTAAIQEMKAIIDAQSVTINDLKARIETLEIAQPKTTTS